MAVQDVTEVVVTLVELGDASLADGDAGAARTSFVEAWEILPLPKLGHRHAPLVLGALADVAFAEGDYATASRHLDEALRTTTGDANPALHLRRGQVAFELGERDRAVEELLVAYELAGAEIFDGEDPKYLRLLYQRVGLRPVA